MIREQKKIESKSFRLKQPKGIPTITAWSINKEIEKNNVYPTFRMNSLQGWFTKATDGIAIGQREIERETSRVLLVASAGDLMDYKSRTYVLFKR